MIVSEQLNGWKKCLLKINEAQETDLIELKINNMQQDKNFHIRLRAAIEKRLKAHGLVGKHGIMPTHDKDVAYTDKQKREWAFIESLDEITLEFLQGQKKPPVETSGLQSGGR